MSGFLQVVRIAAASLLAATAVSSAAAQPAAERYAVIVGGTRVGHLRTDAAGGAVRIDYDYKNNGRGPTIAETIRVGADGLPTAWTVRGSTTFGSKVDESFALAGAQATWTDSTGKGRAAVREPSLYVAQGASPWAAGLYARALLKDSDRQMAALPGGTLRLEKIGAVEVAGKPGPVRATAYSLSGIDLNPQTMLLDDAGAMVAYVTPSFIVVREGHEGEEKRLRDLAAGWSTDRLAAIQKRAAHNYGAPVRITNVRLFDAKAAALTGPVSVLVRGNRIEAVGAPDARGSAGEVTVDGAGGTLVPGLYEMHAHLGDEDAVLNLLAGITSVRDMGNDNDVLDELVKGIEAGRMAGPRVIRSGFIEGKSPYNSNNGKVVDSETKAVEAVRWYAERGFPAIKIYNSINPAWVPAMVKEAHARKMHVMGHVPAFSTADAMIAAGYDEMTHINQVMLGWVIKPTEDTRTLFRLTALKRLPALDLNSAPVQRTIRSMVDRKVAIDPTIGIHENLLTNRDGKVPLGAVDYIDHMPVGAQRSLRQAWIDTSAPGDDAAYRGAYDRILATTRMLNDRGVLIVPGTDTGGALTFHRELELMQRIGMTPAQVLKRATLDMAAFTGQGDRLGSIEAGKLADFFLVPGDPTQDLKAIKRIAMVVKDGTFYYPAEVYPSFGIKPFASAPKVTVPGRR
jgi:imidazolonepropionase-like amidohydrolase